MGMRHFISLLAAAVLAACGSDVTAPSLPGTYLLKSVDGAAVPAATTKLFTTPATVLNGSVTLENGGTWSADILFQLAGDKQTQVLHKAGTYTIDGTKVTFIEPGSAAATAILDSRRITVEQGGVQFVFEG